MSRTPLIAGNWKMYKTEAEAERYIQELLPRVSSVDAVDVAICVPYTDLRAWSTAHAAHASRSTRRTCTRIRRAHSRGRSPRRCSAA